MPEKITKYSVTDHAVLRYLAQFGHVDVEAVRLQILGDTQEALASGASKARKDGVEYILKDRRVVAVHDVREVPRKLWW